MTEIDRLRLVEERDGYGAMLKFAEQGLYLYVKAAVDNSIYKDSINEYIKILRSAGYQVHFVTLRKSDKYKV